MAGSLKSGPRSDEFEEVHEINVTPFIDVMLVLLIIFMVAAPLATVDINVDLPASTAEPAERPDEPIYLTLKSDLSLALGNEPVQAIALQRVLDGQTQGNRRTRIFVRADKSVAYGDLMELMNTLRETGYLSIALVGLEKAPQQVTEQQAVPSSVSKAQNGIAIKPSENPVSNSGVRQNPATSIPAKAPSNEDNSQ